MEPIPESIEAAESFGPFLEGEDDVLDYLTRSAEVVRAFVPSLYGLSLAALRDGVSFTVVASSGEVAALDGVQYLDDGPCVAGAHEDRVLTYDAGDPTDESDWALFARATAAEGVASTLTLPVTERGRVVGSVNLYASTPHAFDGQQEHIAAVFHAWAEGAVTNADLGFETRRASQRAPAVLRAQVVLSQAIGLLMARRSLDAVAARELIEDAAARAGVADVEIARRIVEDHNSDAGGSA